MTDFKDNLTALATYLPYQGEKYINPSKAGVREKEMLAIKVKAQKARQAFTTVAEGFEKLVPGFERQKTSQWMNQAQLLRPHFWVYFIEEGRELSQPALALRLLNQSTGLGISLEVSIIERSLSTDSLVQQNRVLDVQATSELYYFVQRDGQSQRVPMSEANRHALREAVFKGEVRKVQVKYDLPDLAIFSNQDELFAALKSGWERLMPYYQATKVD